MRTWTHNNIWMMIFVGRQIEIMLWNVIFSPSLKCNIITSIYMRKKKNKYLNNKRLNIFAPIENVSWMFCSIVCVFFPEFLFFVWLQMKNHDGKCTSILWFHMQKFLIHKYVLQTNETDVFSFIFFLFAVVVMQYVSINVSATLPC